MGTISVSLPSDGDTIDAADYNTPIQQVVDEINGNLDNANIDAAAAIAGTKLADSAITTAKINDDAVTAAKIDWASTGAGGGIWWEELGRTTLGSAGDSISVSIAARKYLRIITSAIPSGNTSVAWVFNNDTSTNYSQRTTVNDTAATGTGQGTLGTGLGTAISTPWYAIVDVVNISTKEKLATGSVITQSTAGSGTAPSISTFVAKWVNTSDQITTVTATNAGSGDFATGSEIIVLGHD